jgi:hypothetical protein
MAAHETGASMAEPVSAAMKSKQVRWAVFEEIWIVKHILRYTFKRMVRNRKIEPPALYLSDASLFLLPPASTLFPT